MKPQDHFELEVPLALHKPKQFCTVEHGAFAFWFVSGFNTDGLASRDGLAATNPSPKYHKVQAIQVLPHFQLFCCSLRFVFLKEIYSVLWTWWQMRKKWQAVKDIPKRLPNFTWLQLHLCQNLWNLSCLNSTFSKGEAADITDLSTFQICRILKDSTTVPPSTKLLNLQSLACLQ